MLRQVWLATALLAWLAPRSGGGALGPRGGGDPAGCLSPAGCDSPESGHHLKAPCGQKGCGARAAGEPCGVYTPGCARGLRCVPRPSERAPLHALLRGKGVCKATAAAAAASAGAGGKPAAGRRNQTEAAEPPGPGDTWKETRGTGHSTQEPLLLQSQGSLPEVSKGSVQLQQLSLSSDTKQEFETGPCRIHLAAILQELKAPLYLSGEDIFIPNCDTKGFYRRKQCRPSKGLKRGQCWCVDKRGHQLEGLEENPLCLLPGSD
ncbi:insulin-like growth factor-binding protein 6 [Heteronotia binoei]|uniref:insulin-like growth factor-binding protein 6 n=1 Tax=Heteronotia binoei TaxID=13085 RepID=UPI00292FAE70|nr:insulin-like growth factor-binding protein 6 [Heteronotia binoei]